MIQILISPFVWILDLCYRITRNYGFAIILFTLFSKIILLPLSVWVQKYSIKMVKMQPELNYMKVKFFGDKERIAEEEAAIYKKNKYNPFVSIIPTIIQLLLLMAVIEVIKAGINSGMYDMNFFGCMLSVIPSKTGGWYILSPVLAALSAFFMCVSQNKSNVIQAEQSKISQIITMAISVGLSLYLGFFVSVGVAVYWICSNLFAIIQLYALNFFINPKKYVDYEELEKSRAALRELNEIGNGNQVDASLKKLYAKREKEDYKRFFSVVNKHLVFYSESNGFYKYFRGLIQYLLDKTNITIHYITSDPNDSIFETAKQNDRIRAYYIGEKRLITLMMKMDADIVVMTMPDLETYHIKRSYVRKDIEYIFVQHGLGSINMAMRKGAVDHFDTIFCPDKSQKEEIRALEKVNGLKEKTIVECGYFLLDDMLAAYKEMTITPEEAANPYILIAPSWQEGNIVDSCLDELLEELSKLDYRVVVRPHPQHVKNQRGKLENIKEKYSENERIEVQLDFSATDTVWKAALLICDWSDIAMEYAFTTNNPVLFIDTPMKVMNPDYKQIDVVPMNIEIREVAGLKVSPEELDKVPEIINTLFENKEYYAEKITEYTSQQLYNPGTSASVGGKYIMQRLMERKKEKT